MPAAERSHEVESYGMKIWVEPREGQADGVSQQVGLGG